MHGGGASLQQAGRFYIRKLLQFRLKGNVVDRFTTFDQIATYFESVPTERFRSSPDIATRIASRHNAMLRAQLKHIARYLPKVL